MVYPRLYGIMKKHGIRVVNPEVESLSTEEQEYLRQAYQVLNGYSPNALKALHAREKRRIRRHLRAEADHMNAEVLKGQYETAFKKSFVERPEDLRKYLADALKKTESV